jgi:cytochrome c553
MQGQAFAGVAARLRSVLAAVLVLPMPLLAADAATIERAEKIVHGKCFICHGIEGETSSQAFPRLAGQHATYLSRQLADFQSGRRKSGTMQPMVDGLTAEDFAALGDYFESRPVESHPVADEALARSGREIFVGGKPAAGVAACASCHGPNGHGTDTLPRLAGQHALYIENQVRAFVRRERGAEDTAMQAIAAGLSEAEVKAVAAYISGLK